MTRGPTPKKPEKIAERLLVIMSQNYSTDYTKVKAHHRAALLAGITQMQADGVKLTAKLLNLLPPAEVDGTPEELRASGVKGALLRRAAQRAHLRKVKGAEQVMAALLEIRADKLPDPDVQHSRCQLVLDMPRPANVSIARLMAYVTDAVGCWSGQFNPSEDPLFGFASNEELNPIRVRPIEYADKLPRSMADATKRFATAAKELDALDKTVERIRKALEIKE